MALGDWGRKKKRMSRKGGGDLGRKTRDVKGQGEQKGDDTQRSRKTKRTLNRGGGESQDREKERRVGRWGAEREGDEVGMMFGRGVYEPYTRSLAFPQENKCREIGRAHV